MASLLHSNGSTIKYFSLPGSKAAVSFTPSVPNDGYDDAATVNNGYMLVESATLQIQRNMQERHFINDDKALMMGKGTIQLTLQGLFGTADDMGKLMGDPTKPCDMMWTIAISAGILKQCDQAGNPSVVNTELSSDIGQTLIVSGCVANNMTIQTQVNQEGTLYQQATISFIATDAYVNNSKPNGF
jgi:hypothetical protein